MDDKKILYSYDNMEAVDFLNNINFINTDLDDNENDDLSL